MDKYKAGQFAVIAPNGDELSVEQATGELNRLRDLIEQKNILVDLKNHIDEFNKERGCPMGVPGHIKAVVLSGDSANYDSEVRNAVAALPHSAIIIELAGM